MTTMTKPSQALIWMGGFLIAVGLLVSLVAARLIENFQANPFFNGVILAVLVFGVFVNVRQVLLLARDVEWIELFKRSPPDRPLPIRPKLLAPMARMIGTRERGGFSLSSASLRSILDSVYLRLEESRDLSRYLVGLAIFLGLLGTFWGLLVTIRSVADIIGSLGVGADPVAAIEHFLGLWALRDLQVRQFPSLVLPSVTITTLYPGADPALVERQISVPIEAAVGAVVEAHQVE